jgi:hypothetical protein
LRQTIPIIIAGGVQRFFKRAVAVVGAGQGRHQNTNSQNCGTDHPLPPQHHLIRAFYR